MRRMLSNIERITPTGRASTCCGKERRNTGNDSTCSKKDSTCVEDDSTPLEENSTSTDETSTCSGEDSTFSTGETDASGQDRSGKAAPCTDNNDSSKVAVLSQVDTLLPGCTPRKYTPLLQRQTCDSLEGRIAHYAKRRKFI